MPETCILHISFDLPPNSIWGMANAVYSLAKTQSLRRQVCVAVPHSDCLNGKPEVPVWSPAPMLYVDRIAHSKDVFYPQEGNNYIFQQGKVRSPLGPCMVNHRHLR
jgi:hypothetical protein